MARTFFVFWCVGTLGVVGAMSRAGCETSERDRVRAGQTWSAGWRLRYRLPAEHVLTPWIVAQLVDHGPLPGTREEIELEGPERAWGAELRRAGFVVVTSAMAEGSEPQLDIEGRDGVRWSGRFPEVAAPSAGERLMDEVILQRLERGEVVAPYVAVGCVGELRSTGRTKDFWTL